MYNVLRHSNFDNQQLGSATFVVKLRHSSRLHRAKYRGQSTESHCFIFLSIEMEGMLQFMHPMNDLCMSMHSTQCTTQTLWRQHSPNIIHRVALSHQKESFSNDRVWVRTKTVAVLLRMQRGSELGEARGRFRLIQECLSLRASVLV